MPDTELALCPDCLSKIGGACAGPDMPYRAAREGEPCGAADHDEDGDDVKPATVEVLHSRKRGELLELVSRDGIVVGATGRELRQYIGLHTEQARQRFKRG